MTMLAAIVIVGCFAALAFHYWNQGFGPNGPLGTIPFSPWLWTGLMLPLVGWLLLNSALLPGLPPLIPEIAIARSTRQSWLPLVFSLTGPGLLFIGSLWTAVSFAWLAAAIYRHAESQRDFMAVAGAVSLLCAPLAGLCAWGGGWAWAGISGVLWFLPVTHCTLWLAAHPDKVPMYARAIARMKLGKYKEAEEEVIQQLEKRADDFDGWLMLAELYAAQFGDLNEAERTISWLCDQPTTSPFQIATAFHRLADWHLKLCDNPAAARRALDEISRRLPDTHLAKMATLRQSQLPRSREEWMEKKIPRKIALPALTGEINASPAPASKLSRSEALVLAERYVTALNQNPNDVAVREKFARTLTEQLDKANLGLEQLALLLDMPDQPELKKAEWLSLSAAWQVRYCGDRNKGRALLERLIHELPQTPQAFAAQRWLGLWEMEEKLQRASVEQQQAAERPAPSVP
jgi:hypothetical protein